MTLYFYLNHSKMEMAKRVKVKSNRKLDHAPTFFFLSIMLLVFTCGACAHSNSKGNRSSMGNDQKGAPVIYAALGDSTGVGVGAKEGGYVARLFTRIKSVRPDSTLTNVCVSGAETEDV